VVGILSVELVEAHVTNGFVSRNSSGLNQNYAMIVGVQTGECNLSRGGTFSIVELADEQRTSRIDAEPSGGERIRIDRGRELFGIHDLQSLGERVNLDSGDSRVEKADGIKHGDRNVKRAGTGLDQRH
jgi:hypothetical protein